MKHTHGGQPAHSLAAAPSLHASSKTPAARWLLNNLYHPHFNHPYVAAFQQQIQQECLVESAIDPSLYRLAVDFVLDEGRWEPQQALNHEIKRFWHTRPPHHYQTLACFRQATGALWQAKPQNPRLEKKHPERQLTKVIKYETPKGARSTPYLPPITAGIWRRIATRYQVKVPGAIAALLDSAEAPGFWDWVQSIPSLPLVITEGAKKALSLLSHGYIGVSLYGIHGGYRSKDALGHPVQSSLIPDLLPFVEKDLDQSGRPIILAFDQDTKPKTRHQVNTALCKFGRLLSATGASVKIAKWDSTHGKGIDDVITSTGVGFFEQAVTTALSLEEFYLHLALDNRLAGMMPQCRLKTADLTSIQSGDLPETGVIAISSAKGTGKTKMIAELVKGHRPMLLLTHRVVLGRNLCRRLAIDYRADLDKVDGRFINDQGYTLRVGSVVDSLLAIHPGPFPPGSYDVVIDEVDQVLRHLLTSTTCNKDGKRVAILARFAKFISEARRVIVADADLTTNVIRYLNAFRPAHEQPWLLSNEAKPTPWPVTFIESPDASEATAKLLATIQAGHKVFIATDSKALSKKLDRLIAKTGKSALLLNSETSGGEVERDFIEEPDAHLSDWDVVIATPSMATGVSIEADYFETVYGVFQGASATDADMAQALARVRAPVPRVVWCARQGRNFSRIGRETMPHKLKKLLHDKTDVTALLTAASLRDVVNLHQEVLTQSFQHYDWDNPHVNLWSTFEAGQNRAMLSLRSALKVRLLHEGHQLNVLHHQTNQSARDALKAARQDIKMMEAQAIAKAPLLTETQARVLDQIEGLSPEELLALKKYHLGAFYGAEVTPELVLLDNDGRYRTQLQHLEHFLYPDTASRTEVHAISNQIKWGQPSTVTSQGITPWDIPHTLLQQKLRKTLGLNAFVSSTKEWTGEELTAFKAKALRLAPQIKGALNITLRDSMSPAQILGQLLNQLGLKTKSRQHRVEGKRKRTYALDQESKGLALEILQRRAERRGEKNDQERRETDHPSLPVTPPRLMIHDSAGCDGEKEERQNVPQENTDQGVHQFNIPVVERQPLG